ncbi:hypothetical protein V1477_001537 [Vespula maculifrons]|uniref:Uncharacterized protein n=1 Tax=Vespula maculifrons TaxID=7453 RepID=A0ABD2D043_VESMC
MIKISKIIKPVGMIKGFTDLFHIYLDIGFEQNASAYYDLPYVSSTFVLIDSVLFLSIRDSARLDGPVQEDGNG